MTVPELLQRFQQIIAHSFGLVFDESRLHFLENVLRQRAGSTPWDVYLTRLERGADPRELTRLAQEVTVAETYFFRHAEQLRAFSELALPSMAARRGRVSILSAGCSTGEEPYTLAILAGRQPVQILALDLNQASLARAAEGRYSSWALRETPAEQRERWFVQEGKHLRLDRSLRESVRFEARNLIEDDPDFWRPEVFDIIFCRNVLMYFEPELARQVVARMARSLVPGGFLFLGHAETLRGLSDDFHLQHNEEAFFYQRKERLGELSEPAPALPPVLSQVLESSQSWVEAIGAASERVEALAQTPLAKAHDSSLAKAHELLSQERFGEALQSLPGGADIDVLLLRAVLLTHGGQLREAEETCRALLAAQELTAGAHYVMALCRDAAGDREAAISHNQLAGHLDPGFAMPHLQLGLLARRANQYDTARRELGRALALLQREEPSRLLLFGGGFSRDALIALCQAELKAVGGAL